MIKKLDKEFADPNIGSPLWRWEPKPSVYYKNGHVTLQHETRENLGYTYASHMWHWLFFGNVSRTVWEDCRKRLYPRVHPDPRPGKLQFAARARATRPPGFGSYSWSDGLRTEWAEKGAKWQTNSASGRGDLLVEIWIQNKLQDVFRPQSQVDEHVLKSHPSRGHFYWVAGDKAMRSALHDLVGEIVKRWPAAFKQRGSPLH
jgi:hypothetical protein